MHVFSEEKWALFFPEWTHGEFVWRVVLVGATVKSYTALVSGISIIHRTTGTDSEDAWLHFSHLLSGCCQSVALFCWLCQVLLVCGRVSLPVSAWLSSVLWCYLYLAFIAALTQLCVQFICTAIRWWGHVMLPSFFAPGQAICPTWRTHTHTHTHTEPQIVWHYATLFQVFNMSETDSLCALVHWYNMYWFTYGH